MQPPGGSPQQSRHRPHTLHAGWYQSVYSITYIQDTVNDSIFKEATGIAHFSVKNPPPPPETIMRKGTVYTHDTKAGSPRGQGP